MSYDDFCVWADGAWCYIHELDEYQHMSDDYIIFQEGSNEYYNFLNELLE